MTPTERAEQLTEIALRISEQMGRLRAAKIGARKSTAGDWIDITIDGRKYTPRHYADGTNVMSALVTEHGDGFQGRVVLFNKDAEGDHIELNSEIQPTRAAAARATVELLVDRLARSHSLVMAEVRRTEHRAARLRAAEEEAREALDIDRRTHAYAYETAVDAVALEVMRFYHAGTRPEAQDYEQHRMYGALAVASAFIGDPGTSRIADAARQAVRDAQASGQGVDAAGRWLADSIRNAITERAITPTLAAQAAQAAHPAPSEPEAEAAPEAPETPTCARCGRESHPWPVKRPNTCSPKDWAHCIRQPEAAPEAPSEPQAAPAAPAGPSVSLRLPPSFLEYVYGTNTVQNPDAERAAGESAVDAVLAVLATLTAGRATVTPQTAEALGWFADIAETLADPDMGSPSERRAARNVIARIKAARAELRELVKAEESGTVPLDTYGNPVPGSRGDAGNPVRVRVDITEPGTALLSATRGGRVLFGARIGREGPLFRAETYEEDSEAIFGEDSGRTLTARGKSYHRVAAELMKRAGFRPGSFEITVERDPS